MGNYVIGVGNYVIVSPSQLGNYKIADNHSTRPSLQAARTGPARAASGSNASWLNQKVKHRQGGAFS